MSYPEGLAAVTRLTFSSARPVFAYLTTGEADDTGANTCEDMIFSSFPLSIHSVHSVIYVRTERRWSRHQQQLRTLRPVKMNTVEQKLPLLRRLYLRVAVEKQTSALAELFLSQK